MTHTYALLRVSKATYDEVRALLDAAGYGSQFIRNPIDPDHPRLDMHGIALVPEEEAVNLSQYPEQEVEGG